MARIKRAPFKGTAAVRVVMKLVDVSIQAGLADGLDRTEANGRPETCPANGRYAVLQKLPHFAFIHRVVVPAVRMPAVGNPLRLVEHFPGVDSIPVTRRQPQKRPEHLFDKSPTVGGNGLRP